MNATFQKPLMDLVNARSAPTVSGLFTRVSLSTCGLPIRAHITLGPIPNQCFRWIQRQAIERQADSTSQIAHMGNSRPIGCEILETLPCFAPRIAFRDVSRATDSRTVRVALVPPEVFIVHLAPYLLWPRGDEKDQTFMLGTLSSIPLSIGTQDGSWRHMSIFLSSTLSQSHALTATVSFGSASCNSRGVLHVLTSVFPPGRMQSVLSMDPLWTMRRRI